MSLTLKTPVTTPMQRSVQSGAVQEVPAAHDALRGGMRLDEFEIRRVLGTGGFGIVYLAFDHVLQRDVAIKEYMPCALAGRSSGAAVAVRSDTLADTFALGLESFFTEARFLASFDHPSLVKVYRAWKAHGTAYMAMPYYPGTTLKQVRQEMLRSPDEAWLRAFVEPLLGVLELLHGEGVFHRDIAPDNILLLPDGRPVLLDFGSARRVIGDRTQSLTAVLKPNFAPIELYGDVPEFRQGPWTDLYALGATVHFMLTGQAPTPAVLRAVRDVMPALSTAGATAYPGVRNSFLAVIDWALALAPGDRPQSVASVRQALAGQILPPAPSARHGTAPELPGTEAAKLRLAQDMDYIDVPIVTQATAAAGPVPSRATSAASRTSRPAKRLWAVLAAGVVLTLAAYLMHVRLESEPAAIAGAEARPEVAVVASEPAAPTRAAATTPGPAGAPAVTTTAKPTSEVAKTALQGSPAARVTVPAAAVADSPRQACGELNFLSMAVCLSRECQTPRWQAHAQCVEPRRIEAQRQRDIDRL
jgi:serine/threonine protein kinase